MIPQRSFQRFLTTVVFLSLSNSAPAFAAPDIDAKEKVVPEKASSAQVVSTPTVKSEAVNPDPSRVDQNPLAKKVQEALAADSALSDDAKNTLVEIDLGGKVVLRGVADSAEERARIENHALKIVGDGKVVNHIDVESEGDDELN